MATQTAIEIDLTPPTEDRDLADYLARNIGIIREILGVGVGITDTFTTSDGKTVTVENGIIKSII